jgi:hypothetical protein
MIRQADIRYQTRKAHPQGAPAFKRLQGQALTVCDFASEPILRVMHKKNRGWM